MPCNGFFGFEEAGQNKYRKLKSDENNAVFDAGNCEYRLKKSFACCGALFWVVFSLFFHLRLKHLPRFRSFLLEPKGLNQAWTGGQ